MWKLLDKINHCRNMFLIFLNVFSCQIFERIDNRIVVFL